MMSEALDSDIACVLRLAFGRSIPITPLAVAPGQSERMLAFALHDPKLPSQVVLLRYSPQQQARAFRAFTVMQALHSLDFPVPAVYYLGWSHTTRFILLLMEYVEGRRDEGQPHAFFARVGTHFAETLAHLHHLPWDSPLDLAVLPFRYLFNDLSRQVRQLGTPELQDIFDWLKDRVDTITELPHTVLHGNYTLQQIVADRTHVSAVLGWENAVLGDPRLDTGYSSAALGAYGITLSDQFLEAYQAAAGPVPDCVFWEVFGALRLLTQIAATLAAVHEADLEEAQELVWPVWWELLAFVEQRTGQAL